MWSEETVKAMLIALATISGRAPVDAAEEQPDPHEHESCGESGGPDAEELTALWPVEIDQSPPGAGAR